MNFLHVSDIHFRGPDAGTDLDPEKMYQDHIIKDVTARAEQFGAASGILVTGDIAFAGKAVEYEAAKAWFDALSQACGCRASAVYMVPGNHDVDQEIIKKNVAVSNAIGSIFNATDMMREPELDRQLSDPEAAEALYRPLQAYNNFARPYQCQIGGRGITWSNGIRLDENTVLNLRGLNSALLCGLKPKEEKGRLFLGARQTGLSPKAGCISLVLAHHPPDWLLDKDGLEDRTMSAPAIILFGHQHRPIVSQNETDCIEIKAGSANPDRRENQWSPAYGWLTLNVANSAENRKARLRVRQYVWQRMPAGFEPKKYAKGLDYRDYTIPISGVYQDKRESIVTPLNSESSAMTEDHDRSSDQPPSRQIAPNIRDMMFNIWRMSYADRKSIFGSLGLAESTSHADEEAWVETAFDEAVESGRIVELQKAIAEKART